MKEKLANFDELEDELFNLRAQMESIDSDRQREIDEIKREHNLTLESLRK